MLSGFCEVGGGFSILKNVIFSRFNVISRIYADMYTYVCTFAIQSNVRGINLSKDMFGNACFLKCYHSNSQCIHNKQNFI